MANEYLQSGDEAGGAIIIESGTQNELVSAEGIILNETSTTAATSLGALLSDKINQMIFGGLVLA